MKFIFALLVSMAVATTAMAQEYRNDCLVLNQSYQGEKSIEPKPPRDEYHERKKAVGIVYEVDTYRVQYIPQVSKVKSERKVVYCDQATDECY